MIQIRNVPDEIHSVLKARAALEGMSLSDYLLREVRNLSERPSPDELRSRLRSRKPIRPRLNSAEMVRSEREQR